MVAALVLLSPWGALACLVAAPPAGPTLRAAALALVAASLLGLSVAQPVLETTTQRRVRSESQVVFVVDVSRSMLAAAGPGETSRLEQAREVVARLRASVSDAPAGLAGMTDRVLPYLFPTIDLSAFDQTLARSVLVEAPPPGEVHLVATSFGDLTALARSGYFTPKATRRSCVVVTDGEVRAAGVDQDLGGGLSSSGQIGHLGTPQGAGSLGGSAGADGASGTLAEVGAALGGQRGCALVVVRVGTGSDRIFRADGRLEGQYRPDAGASGNVRELAEAAGGRAFEAGAVDAAADAIRGVVEAGPTQKVGTGRTLRRLAPWSALAGGLLSLLLVVVRMRSGGVRQQNVFEYRKSLEGL
jgi:hypothetical protein